MNTIYLLCLIFIFAIIVRSDYVQQRINVNAKQTYAILAVIFVALAYILCKYFKNGSGDCLEGFGPTKRNVIHYIGPDESSMIGVLEKDITKQWIIMRLNTRYGPEINTYVDYLDWYNNIKRCDFMDLIRNPKIAVIIRYQNWKYDNCTMIIAPNAIVLNSNYTLHYQDPYGAIKKFTYDPDQYSRVLLMDENFTSFTISRGKRDIAFKIMRDPYSDSAQVYETNHFKYVGADNRIYSFKTDSNGEVLEHLPITPNFSIATAQGLVLDGLMNKGQNTNLLTPDIIASRFMGPNYLDPNSMPVSKTCVDPY